MITNLKRKMGKKVFCVMLTLTTVLANVDSPGSSVGLSSPTSPIPSPVPSSGVFGLSGLTRKAVVQ